MMPRLSLFFLLFFLYCNVQADEVTIIPSEVYAQVLLIDQETELVRQFFNNTAQPQAITELTIDLQPRHIWQKGYMLQMKLVAFRRKHQLDGIAPVGIEPKEHIDPRYAWAQTQRILTEIRIIRKLLGIPGSVGAAPQVSGKKPVDTFNKLAHVEADWDALTGSGFDASYTFSQTMRLDEDINMILQQLDIFDSAVPPAKNPLNSSTDSLAQAFLVLAQIQRLQKLAGLDVIDLSAFRKSANATPTDVFNLVCLILAEVEQIKSRIGLTHAITPAATYHENKKPADVRQLLGYITNKLALIEHL